MTTETEGTQANPPGPQTELALKKLAAETGEPQAPTESPSGDQGTGTQEPGAEPTAAAGPQVPPAPMMSAERPWKEIVEGGVQIIQKNAPNWEWPEQGTGLFTWGLEAQLTRWMPNGLADLDKYPWAACLIGLGWVVLTNTDFADDEKGKLTWRVRPLRKPKTAGEGEGVKTKAEGAAPGGTVEIKS